jgi:type II secretory pathway pseudopilin PulG
LATKKCPFCAEEIQEEAVKCRWCGSMLDGSQSGQSAAVPTAVAPGAPATYTPYKPPAQTNGFAIASLVVGIIFFGIGSILALIFGYVGKGQIDRSEGREEGRGLAIAGIVVGWVGVVLSVIAIIAFVALLPTLTRIVPRAMDLGAQTDLRSALDTSRSYYAQHGGYTGFDAPAASALDPSTTWSSATPAANGTVTIDYADSNTVVMSTLSFSGAPFCVAEEQGKQPTVVYGNRDAYGVSGTSGCAPTGSYWSTPQPWWPGTGNHS